MRLLAVTAVALGVTAALASAAVGLTVKSSKNAALGATIVVSATGKTLYHPNAKCTGACAETWPPLLVAAGHKPVAGVGISAAKLGTVKLPDGKLQVTYAGHTLFLYSGDAKAGDVNGQGTAGLWHVVSASGAIVTKMPAAASSSSSSSGYGAATTTTTTTSPGGYGDY
jgi:predicted lipoprotein with Yx(FWY)xxD motif